MSLASWEIRRKRPFHSDVNVMPDTPDSNKEIRLLLLDELLDYSLRESISEQTEDVRNVILANAFSRHASSARPRQEILARRFHKEENYSLGGMRHIVYFPLHSTRYQPIATFGKPGRRTHFSDADGI